MRRWSRGCSLTIVFVLLNLHLANPFTMPSSHKSTQGPEAGQPDDDGLDNVYRKTTREEDVLETLGVEPSNLQRNFNIWSLAFMGFCTSVTWEAVSSAMAQGLFTGGSTSLVWGFVLCAIGALLIIACFAEYASMIPTAGGQHHFVFELAPPKLRRILSWYIGWMTILGWVLCALAGIFATTMQFQAWAILFRPNYIYERWHTTLVS